MQRWTMVTLWGLASILALFLGFMHIRYDAIAPDEPVHLYAAREVAHGRLPYRDAAYLDAPLMPFVYSAASRLIDAQGMAAGRGLSFVLGLGAALLAARLAAR
jgi:hypothetical protein